jgi:predicted transcriptional regulator
MGKLAELVRDWTYQEILDEVSGVHLEIVKKLRELGKVGATRHELAHMLRRPLSSMCGRINELEKAGIVCESGDTRQTEYGKPATVVTVSSRVIERQKLVQQELF